MEPHIELHYNVRFYDPVRKKWMKSRYKMSPETAALHYAHTEYELIESTKEERKVGGDPLADSMAHFNPGREG